MEKVRAQWSNIRWPTPPSTSKIATSVARNFAVIKTLPLIRNFVSNPYRQRAIDIVPKGRRSEIERFKSSKTPAPKKTKANVLSKQTKRPRRNNIAPEKAPPEAGHLQSSDTATPSTKKEKSDATLRILKLFRANTPALEGVQTESDHFKSSDTPKSVKKIAGAEDFLTKIGFKFQYLHKTENTKRNADSLCAHLYSYIYNQTVTPPEEGCSKYSSTDDQKTDASSLKKEGTTHQNANENIPDNIYMLFAHLSRNTLSPVFENLANTLPLEYLRDVHMAVDIICALIEEIDQKSSAGQYTPATWRSARYFLRQLLKKKQSQR